MESKSERIQAVLNTAKKRKLLSTYITAGDPDTSLMVPLLHTQAQAGVDIIELGIPFTDPAAEGPVIQAAMQRALRRHVNIKDVLGYVSEFRQTNQQTPIVLMGYLNPVEIMGYESFVRQAHTAGVDGIILVDLPPEEATILTGYLQDYPLDLISLFSPTTSPDRLHLLQEVGSGYLYYVALKGVTGAGSLDVDLVAKSLARHRAILNMPVMIGFGIKTPEHAKKLAVLADGVVVGSALIQLMTEHVDDPEAMHEAVGRWIGEIRQILDTID